jgi:hypothetical protein
MERDGIVMNAWNDEELHYGNCDTKNAEKYGVVKYANGKMKGCGNCTIAASLGGNV